MGVFVSVAPPRPRTAGFPAPAQGTTGSSPWVPAGGDVRKGSTAAAARTCASLDVIISRCVHVDACRQLGILWDSAHTLRKGV
ncbi:hypothetical protein TRAPUB_13028 [Trametes pubescens]|uniref:Uncharacterized protein n=1 Tax=Trametes pubescens TaxID=154538 RepID=A0A1M2VS34_TRAPU|nr:hypothetical protein TRAPUB_13028 [Trametes pubescens]